MVSTPSGRKENTLVSGPIIVVAIMYFLPTLNPAIFGWLNGVLAAPVFYLLTISGEKQGTIQLRNSLLLAAIGALLMQRIEVLLFSITLIPLGYALHKSRRSNDSPAVSGGKGILILGVTWTVYWLLYGMITDIHPYRQLLELMDSGFAQTYEIYSKQADISVEALYNLKQVIDDIRLLIPRLLPGILGCTIIATVWVNLVAGNSLIRIIGREESPWGRYTSWKLPEQLIWLPIAATITLLLGGGSVRDISAWVVLISCLIYFFQGLAVFLHMLDRWKVPIYLRVILYFVLILQSYGLVLLTILGIGDVWFNFRRPPRDQQETDD